jgi:fermentation-respiration switch protein FrsA (DUF1100 family)
MTSYPIGAGSGKASLLSPSRERLVFSLAAAVLVAHVIVDAFVAPEPGSARSDHLVSAAVPVALVALAVWIYPRARPSVRASVALVLGALMLVGAGIALVHAVAEGPSGDDWTGFLLAPAGLALVALGTGLLWRSRKHGGRRFGRRALLAVAAFLLAYEVVLPIAFAIVATHRPREAVEPADLGRAYAPVTLRTADGLDLAGWYVPSTNGAAVIAFPDRTGLVKHARMLVRHGYGVLLLDMRGYGDSEGDPNAFGWGSAPDVDAAVAFLRSRPDVEAARIGGLGLSVGGEVLLEAAADNPALAAVVSEGAGERSVRETLLRGAAGALTIPQRAVQTIAVTALSGNLPPPALDEVAARIAPRPIFLIHAENGGGGEDLNPDYFQAAGEPKELWKISGAGHTGGLDTQPQEYERRVIGFFDRALLRTGSSG